MTADQREMTEERKRHAETLHKMLMDNVRTGWLTTDEMAALTYAIEELSRDIPAQDWKKYPENKPEKDGLYLVTHLADAELLMVICLWRDGYFEDLEASLILVPTAFTNLPEPFSPHS